tara:strand:+ start:737 stop:1399 length:663 start_codon:yes stop_codon:yes gene_type:complete
MIELSKKKLLMIILVLLLVIGIVFVILKVTRQHPSSDIRMFYKEPKNASEHAMIPKSSIRKPQNNIYSISFDINVNQWYTRFKQWKHILHIGSTVKDDESLQWDSVPIQSPGIWLTPRINNLRVVFSAQKGYEVHHQYIDIPNIPINESFHLIANITPTDLTLFINGEVVQTLMLRDSTIFSCGNMYLNYDGGFEGTLQNLRYVYHDLDLHEVRKIAQSS